MKDDIFIALVIQRVLLKRKSEENLRESRPQMILKGFSDSSVPPRLFFNRTPFSTYADAVETEKTAFKRQGCMKTPRLHRLNFSSSSKSKMASWRCYGCAPPSRAYRRMRLRIGSFYEPMDAPTNRWEAS